MGDPGTVDVPISLPVLSRRRNNAPGAALTGCTAANKNRVSWRPCHFEQFANDAPFYDVTKWQET